MTEDEHKSNVLKNDTRLIPGLPFYKEPYLEHNHYKGVTRYLFQNVHSYFEQDYLDELKRLDIV